MAGNEHDPLEDFFLTGNPNPKRIGCASQEVLQSVAGRKLDVPKEVFAHLAKCSECSVDVKAYRLRFERRRTRQNVLFASGILIGGIAALALILLLGRSLYWFEGQRKSDRIIALDLRSIDPTRGNDQQHLRVHLPLRVFRLVLTLPFGLSGGVYELQLRNSKDLVAAKARGTATITDGDTRLRVDRMDLSNISKGDYVLILAHGSDRLKADVTVP